MEALYDMAVWGMYKVSKLLYAFTCFVITVFLFTLLFKMGPIHHVGISDISTVLQINGSLTAPAADMDTSLSP